MKAWILIVSWYAGNGSSGVAMQEFSTVEACQWASKQIIQAKETVRTPSMVCVPKGEAK